MAKTDFKTIDDYIAAFPENARKVLQKVRENVRQAVPEAQECISYQMPAFRLEGTLVYFAAHSNHIGFYPTPSGIDQFKDSLKGYKLTKGSVAFPLDKPIPNQLIRDISRFRAEENLAKAAVKQAGKTRTK